MKILTASIDGQECIDGLAKSVLETHFLASGKWSQSPYHQGNFVMCVGWSADRAVYVLEYAPTPADDGFDGSEYDDDDEAGDAHVTSGTYRNVAAATKCTSAVAGVVVKALVAAALKSGDVAVDDYLLMGDFEL